MKIQTTFKKIETSEFLKTYVEDKLNRLDKLLDSPAMAEVMFRTEKLRNIVEINLVGDHLNVYASEAQENMTAAIDLAVDKVRKQITKNKEKLISRREQKKNRAANLFVALVAKGSSL